MNTQHQPTPVRGTIKALGLQDGSEFTYLGRNVATPGGDAVRVRVDKSSRDKTLVKLVDVETGEQVARLGVATKIWRLS